MFSKFILVVAWISTKFPPSFLLNTMAMVVTYFSHSVVSDSCDPMDWSPPGSSVHGIPQAWILEWVAWRSSHYITWLHHIIFIHSSLDGLLELLPPFGYCE